MNRSDKEILGSRGRIVDFCMVIPSENVRNTHDDICIRHLRNLKFSDETSIMSNIFRFFS